MTIHVPVLLEEVLAGLGVRPGEVIIDGTLGGGGHTRALAERAGLVVALDRDLGAIERAETALRGLPVKLAHAGFDELPVVLRQLEIAAVDGVLLDLGLSSDQLADADRGFSFESDGPLDLRFDPTSGEPAWRYLERWDAERLADVIFEYGEERHSRRIARRIVEARGATPIRSARQLAELVRRSVPRSRERIDPSTRTFQALRIAVNDELGALERVLACLPDVLKPGGRVAIISFHSLEDRRVKHAFREDPRWEVLTKKPVTASEGELARNPRSRSAKLRVAQRR